MKLKRKTKPAKSIKSIVSAVFHGVTFYVLLILIASGVLFGLTVYSNEKKVSFEAYGVSDVEKGSRIVLRFSSSMLKQSVQKGLVVSPQIEMKTLWNSDKEIVLIPTQNLKPDSKYNLKIKGARSKWRVLQEEFSFDLSTPTLPEIKSVYPPDGSEQIDYFEKIMIEFKSKVREEFIIHVGIKPLSTFDHSFNESRTQLVIEPKKGMEKNKKYALSVNLRNKYFDDINELLYSGTFTTKPPPVIVYNFDKNGNPLKTEERKERIEAQIVQGKYIDIDISSQSLYLFQDGKELGAYKVSTGLSGMDTPIGVHKIIAKSRRPWSAKYKLYMPWFIQFTHEGHGIHELPEWPGGYKEGENHLGIPVSHGCVRLGVGPAKNVYDFAEPGVPIVIHR